jgi:hypothetical protein
MRSLRPVGSSTGTHFPDITLSEKRRIAFATIRNLQSAERQLYRLAVTETGKSADTVENCAHFKLP